MTDIALENMLKSVDKRLKELLHGQSELMAMIRASHPEVWRDREPKKRRKRGKASVAGRKAGSDEGSEKSTVQAWSIHQASRRVSRMGRYDPPL